MIIIHCVQNHSEMPVFRFPINDLKKQLSEAGEGGPCKLKREELGDVCVALSGQFVLSLGCDAMLLRPLAQMAALCSSRYLSVARPQRRTPGRGC